MGREIAHEDTLRENPFNINNIIMHKPDQNFPFETWSEEKNNELATALNKFWL